MLCTLKLLSSLQSKRIKTHDNTTSVQTQEKWSQNEATEGGSGSLAKSVWPSQSTTQGLILKSGGPSTLRPPGGDGETGGRVTGGSGEQAPPPAAPPLKSFIKAPT